MPNTTTLNALSGNAFNFSIRLFPKTEFFVTEVTLPGITVDPVKFPTPFAPMYDPGDSPTFDSLEVTFRVSEDMGNWLEMFDWLSKQSTPSNFATYDRSTIFSDCSLIIMTNKRVPMTEFSFIKAFPYALSGIKMTVLDSTVTYRDATIAFKYQRMEFRRVNA